MLLLHTGLVWTQSLRLVVSSQPLNVVLNTLNLEISYNSKALSAYTVNVAHTFNSPVDALYFLLKDKPFKIEKMGDVFIILPLPEAKIPNAPPSPQTDKKVPFLKAFLYDKHSGEPLPYAHIRFREGITNSNEEGYFSFVCSNDTLFHIQISYLGYNELDTIVYPGKHMLYLKSAYQELNEVFVQPSPTSMLIQSGKIAGEIRSNHQATRYLPGNPDNSVFATLRMMPGVRASGEPSADIIAWGSQIGESQLVFDGYTLFGMKNFNDHISSVNPFLVKDIRLMKGAFDVSQNSRIGAIAEIIGNMGNTASPEVKLNLSNYTGNIFTSVPIQKKSTLSIAYRQTYYTLYDDKQYTTTEDGTKFNADVVYIKPHYSFKDINVRYIGQTSGNDHYYISLYGADDRFRFLVEQNNSHDFDASEKNMQYASAAGYKYRWNNGATAQVTVSFSRFNSGIDNLTTLETGQWQLNHTSNAIQEASVRMRGEFNLGKKLKTEVGTGWQQYYSGINQQINTLNKPGVFVNNKIMLGKLNLHAGLRADFPIHMSPAIQPRLSVQFRASNEWTLTASKGLYAQYISRTPNLNAGHMQMLWNLNDSIALKASHITSGIAYSKNGYLLSAEGYYKQIRNQHYFLDNTIFTSDNSVYGYDIFVKKVFNEHNLFASWSLVNIRMPVPETGQELKAGGIGTLKPFFISFSYVFGTGFSSISNGGHMHRQNNNNNKQYQHTEMHGSPGKKNYNRLDLSLTYHLQKSKYRIQTGISLINVMNSQNVKYNYRLLDTNNITNIYTKATPFTPMLFFELFF